MSNMTPATRTRDPREVNSGKDGDWCANESPRIAAACVAGVMTMETAMELTVQRSRLMQVG